MMRTLFPRAAAGLSLLGAALFSWPACLWAAPPPQLTLADVQTIIAQAVARAVRRSPNAVIAVTDREGFVLGVWSVDGTDPGDDRIGGAIREAGTAAFLSSDNNAFTSRTAQFIIQQNFPPGITNQPTGPLVGVEFSNLPFSDVNRFKRLDVGPKGELPGQPGDGFVNGSLGTGIPNTRLSGRSSSAPLYKNSVLVGGIGVFGAPADTLQVVLTTELTNTVPGKNNDEAVALAGQAGYQPPSSILGNLVTINGIGVPYVLAGHGLPEVPAFNAAGNPAIGKAVNGYSLHAAPPLFPYPIIQLGGQPCEVRFPICDDPTLGTIEGQPRLTKAEVQSIMDAGSARARITRAGIRLPIGQPMEVFITVVGNPNAAGAPAPILGIVRTPGATMFSFDVALQKARTALFFSSDQRAFSSRTVGFLAQNLYPPGLANTHFGPFGPEVPSVDAAGNPILSTIGLQVAYSGGAAPPSFTGLPVVLPGITPASAFGTAPVSPSLAGQTPPDPNLPNGITVFPGGFPLYRNGVLIGAVGVSGDGVDQDDIVGASASGAPGFAPPDAIRADQLTYDGARLPFAKFPRNPDL